MWVASGGGRGGAQVVGPGGRALVELDPPGRSMGRDQVQIDGRPWSHWESTRSEAEPAAALRITWTATHGRGHFAELMRA